MAISVIGTPTGAAATTVTVPAHAVGDYIVIVAFRSATTAPTLPAGFKDLPTAGTGSGNSCSYRVGYKVATATNDTSGTWTNASGLLCTVYRGVTGIGSGVSATKAASTTATIGTFTVSNQNSASWVVAFAGHAATSTQGTPLAGATTSRITQTAGTFNAGMFDTNAGVNSFSATTSSNTTSVVSFGGAFELIAADAMSSLTDAFNQTSLNTTNWFQFTAGSATMSYTTGGAIVTFPASTTATTDGDISTNFQYNMTSDAAYLAALAVPSAATAADAGFRLYIDGNNWLRWVYEGGTLYAQYMIAGVKSTPFSVAYSSSTHQLWRIRESGGTTFWDTFDGSTWTNQASASNPIAVTGLHVLIAGVGTQVDTSPGTFQWNNFNIAPVTNVTVTPPTASLSLTTFAPQLQAAIIVPPASLTLTTFAPSVNIGTTITPPTASLTLTTFAPSIVLTDNKIVTPPTATLTLTTFAPVVSTPRLVTPPTASLTITTFAPTVTATQNVLVTPPTASLTLTRFAPVVTVGKLIIVPTAALALTTFAPVVLILRKPTTGYSRPAKPQTGYGATTDPKTAYGASTKPKTGYTAPGKPTVPYSKITKPPTGYI